jgi:hypothetical protein
MFSSITNTHLPGHTVMSQTTTVCKFMVPIHVRSTEWKTVSSARSATKISVTHPFKIYHYHFSSHRIRFISAHSITCSYSSWSWDNVIQHTDTELHSTCTPLWPWQPVLMLTPFQALLYGSKQAPLTFSNGMHWHQDMVIPPLPSLSVPIAIIRSNTLFYVHIREEPNISNKEEIMPVNGIRSSNCIPCSRADQHATYRLHVAQQESICSPHSHE